MNTNYEPIILDNIRQGILLLDHKLKFLFINQEAEEILGKSSRALKKNNALKNIDKEIVKLIKGVKKNHKTKFVSEIITRNSLGKENITSIYLKPIFDYKQKTPVLNFILIQFTNLEGMSFLNKKTKFEDEEKLMSQLFYGLAHEIKNPLAGIKGAAQIAKSIENENKTSVECLDIIEKETTRLHSLVDTFKHLQPHSENNYKVIKINKVIDEAITFLSKTDTKKDIKVFFNYEDDSSKVLCDEGLLRIIIQNIIQNSYDSIKNKGEISITIRSTKDFKLSNKDLIQIEIKDSGKGISKKNLNEIFQPFYTTKKNGQGIGLFLSQKIANKFGGFIEAESTLNKGSKFIIYLPDN